MIRLKTLLLSIFLLIQPVSNEQIQQNMGFKQSEVIEYNINNVRPPLKSPGYNRITVTANDGTNFTIVYWVGVGILIDYKEVDVISSGGLNLQSTYPNEQALQAAISAALAEYNRKLMPIGSPFCLFLLGGGYALYKNRKRKKNERISQ